MWKMSESRPCPDLTRRRRYRLKHWRTTKRPSLTLLACLGVSPSTFQLLASPIGTTRICGTAWTLVDGRRRTEAIGERRHASSGPVGRWEHKIKDVFVDRLHRLSISSQLIHSVLAQTYLWPYPPSIRLYTCSPGAISRQFGCNSTHQNLVVRYLTRRCSILAAASLPRGRSLAPARLPFSLGRRTGDITS